MVLALSPSTYLLATCGVGDIFMFLLQEVLNNCYADEATSAS
ncbi:MAG: hypothetical protein ACK4GQ_05920 [Candidatus Hadarchaeales archaeon]